MFIKTMDVSFASSFHSTFPHSKTLPSCSRTRPTAIFTVTAVKSDANLVPIRRIAVTKQQQGIVSNVVSLICNAFDDIIINFIDPPVQPSVDPTIVLAGNFAPVKELPPTPCEDVKGAIPSCLDGAYIRNGPNPQFYPRGPYHLFDGDGMLHAVRISNGKATFCSRFVKTYRYSVEHNAGSSIVPNVFSEFRGFTASVARSALTALRVAAGHFNPTNGIGLANTSLAYFGHRLFALGESDVPYTIRVTPNGDIETLHRHDFDGKLIKSMTAHPKVDPETCEAFAFRHSYMRPYLSYFRFDADGTKQPDVPVFSMVTPSLPHDVAITKKYAIIPDIQICMNPMGIFGGGSPVGADLAKVPRLGVIPKYAKDESNMRWFEVPGFNSMHAVNAWDEEDDVIVMVAPNIFSVEHALDRMDLIHASMEKVRIDLKTGNVSRYPLSARNLEFAVINPAYIGKKNRYVYAGVGDPLPKISGIVKVDVSTNGGQESVVATRMFGSGCFGGEPFFVSSDSGSADEDDGYVVSYVHDENSGVSSFLVMDAKSLSLDIVASVKLPQRVPYGFHGLFVKESDLDELHVGLT